MSICRIDPLLIGDLAAGVCRNEDDVLYIEIGGHDENGEIVAIDEIEARALHVWLGRALNGGR